MKQYIVAYDITCQKRASKVRKLVYHILWVDKKVFLENFFGI